MDLDVLSQEMLTSARPEAFFSLSLIIFISTILIKLIWQEFQKETRTTSIANS